MSSTDEETIDLFRKKASVTRKASKSKAKKHIKTAVEGDSSDSDSDDIRDLSPVKKKPRKHSQYSKSDSADSDADSSPDSDADSSSHEPKEELRKKMVKHRSGGVKGDKISTGKKLKRKIPKQSEEDIHGIESDSEPEVVRKKTEERLTSYNYAKDDDDDDESAAIKEELSHLSFEELQKLRDRLGIKVYNQVLRGGGDKGHLSSAKRTFTRENKNRPMEMSSKRQVPIYREVIPVKKKVIRDPRFDDMSGNFNESIFKSSYAFLDDVKKKEKEKLAKQLKKAKNAEKKQQLKFLINRMNQQEAANQQRERRKELEKEWKKKELGQVQEGKTPYFLKKGDLRKLELAERFKELKKTGKLDKYLGKKRKKNASKEKKKLPSS